MKPVAAASVALTVMLLVAGCPTDQAGDRADAEARGIPANKQTTLGLYVTAAEAYEMWRADPDHVQLLDVRTPGEYIFVGHARAAHNVPYQLLAFRWDPDRRKPVMTANAYFVAESRQRFAPTDLLLVYCRSGQRAAKAVNALAAAGFTNAYNIIDGFEGDKVTDPSSADQGKRTQNGWKNSGAPWTYDLDPDLMYLPEG